EGRPGGIAGGGEARPVGAAAGGPGLFHLLGIADHAAVHGRGQVVRASVAAVDHRSGARHLRQGPSRQCEAGTTSQRPLGGDELTNRDGPKKGDGAGGAGQTPAPAPPPPSGQETGWAWLCRASARSETASSTASRACWTVAMA